jgi:hypothetical protein
MFGFLTSFLGSDSKDADGRSLTEVHAKDALEIEEAMASYENCRLRLKLYLSGSSEEVFTPSIVCSDRHCDLGRWINTKASTHLGRYPGFTALRTHHKVFHLTASNIISLMQADKKEEAEELLSTQFATSSEKALNGLRMMKKVIDADRH